jgi:hypothetical protein
MALRIRSDGRVLCAAHHPEEPGDTYINDGLHYAMSVDHGVLLTLPMPMHAQPGPHMGQWWWRGQAPHGVDDWKGQTP